MMAEAIGGAALAAGVLAYGARARSAALFCPSVWRGPKSRRAIALTFDDGPSEATPDLLSLLYTYKARATFFQLGHHARRLPRIVERCAASGHEIGNHSDCHHALWLRSPQFISEEIGRAQRSISEIAGVAPRLFRAPYGVRWFGLKAALKRHGLVHVAWTVLARDWKLSAGEIVQYVAPRVGPGVILCFHDGRELRHHPDIAQTVTALETLIPRWRGEGYEFVTVSELTAGAGAAPEAV